MGPKITIDSATMMNKGLEIIEAHHLFGVPENADRGRDPSPEPGPRHGGVGRWHGDGAALGQRHAVPDPLRPGLARALVASPLPPLDLPRLPALTFEAPDPSVPLLDLARAALRAGGEMPAVLNAANEVAVAAFLDGRCSFPGVAATVSETLDAWSARNRSLTGIDQALAADAEARMLAADTIMKYPAPVRGSEIRC